jgi:DNA gyrase subunit A
MRLSRLTGLEREKLTTEYRELCEQIDRLTAILSDESLLMQVIVDELTEVRDKYADARRTQIEQAEAEIHIEDLIQEEDMAITISHAGYIKRTPVSVYREQRRGGKGRSGMQAREEDWVKELFVASTHSYVFFFSNLGQVYVKKVYQIPEAAPNARGRAIVNFVGLGQDEKVAAICPVDDIAEGKYIVTLTKRGQIKKTELTGYKNYRETGIIGVRIDEGDELLSVALTDGTSELLIGTKSGLAIRFKEVDVRAMGRATMGVKGIDLGEGDQVVGMGVYKPGDARDRVLAVCELGYGKQTPIEEYRRQGRGGKGVINIDTSERNGPVVGLALVCPTDSLIVITDRGQTLRTTVDGIRETGRSAQGVSIMRVADGERIVAIETFAEEEDEGGEGRRRSTMPIESVTPPEDAEPREPSSEAPEDDSDADPSAES